MATLSAQTHLRRRAQLSIAFVLSTLLLLLLVRLRRPPRHDSDPASSSSPASFGVFTAPVASVAHAYLPSSRRGDARWKAFHEKLAGDATLAAAASAAASSYSSYLDTSMSILIPWREEPPPAAVAAAAAAAAGPVVFFGDSIFESFLGTSYGSPKARAYGVPAVFREYFPANKGDTGGKGGKGDTGNKGDKGDKGGGGPPLVLAIAGDQTQHLLWRMLHGELPDGLVPSVVVLLIGTNNLSAMTGAWMARHFPSARAAYNAHKEAREEARAAAQSSKQQGSKQQGTEQQGSKQQGSKQQGTEQQGTEGSRSATLTTLSALSAHSLEAVEETAAGILAVIKFIRTRRPFTRIVALALLPRGDGHPFPTSFMQQVRANTMYLYTMYCILHTVYCILYTIYYILYTIQCSVRHMYTRMYHCRVTLSHNTVTDTFGHRPFFRSQR